MIALVQDVYLWIVMQYGVKWVVRFAKDQDFIVMVKCVWIVVEQDAYL